MIVVEVKAYSHERGFELLEYIEIQNDGTGDAQLASYDVRRFSTGGNRVSVDRDEVKNFVRRHGALELVRQVLNQWNANTKRKAG